MCIIEEKKICENNKLIEKMKKKSIIQIVYNIYEQNN